MINSPFALEISGLCYYYFSKPNPTQPPPITLQLLENESANVQTSTLPMDYISYYLHSLYKKMDPSGRSSILRILCNLEINSDIPLIEKYKFDDMVCESIQKPIPEQQTKSDDEKISALKYVAFVLQGKQIFPESIIRALIYLYSMPKSSFGKLIISLFAKGILLCDNFPDIPEVANILVDAALSKPESELIDLFGYIFERQCNRPLHKLISYRLIAPFSMPNNNKPKLENATKIVIDLLRTWPGIFCLGLENEVISDFFKSIKTITPSVLKVLQELLLIDGPDQSIVDTYTGFVFYTLLKSGILEKLEEISSENQDAIKLINIILKFAPYAYCSMKSKPEIPKINVNYLSTEKVIDTISQNISDTPLPTQISSYSLPPDSNKWDWPTIRSFLTLTLPSNEIDATSENAIVFYNSLLDYFGSKFLFDNDAVFNPVIAQCLEALIDLILYPSLDLSKLLTDKNNHNIPIAIFGSFQKIFKSSEDATISEYHPAWTIIHVFLRLMSDPLGFHILTKWNSYSDIKKYVENNVNNILPIYARKLLKMVKFSPIYSSAANLILNFLYCNNIEIVEIALGVLEQQSKILPNFYEGCVDLCLFQYIKKLHSQKKTNYVHLALNFLCKLMLSSSECLRSVLKDMDLQDIIRNYSHEIYSIIFSSPQPTNPNSNLNQKNLLNNRSNTARSINQVQNAYTNLSSSTNSTNNSDNSIVENEISYWMESGIFKYVSTYDQAISMAFKKEAKIVPSIIVSNGYALIPPHLFGQLSKTEEGLKRLSACIPRLLQLLNSNHISKRRAAFFALGHLGSVPNGISAEIVAKMIESAKESTSYLLRGTLLVAFSIMKPDPIIANYLYKSGFQLFKFGSHSCIVPIDLNSMLIRTQQQFVGLTEDVQPFSRPQNHFVSTVINCLSTRVNQPRIDLQNLVTTKTKEIATTENSQFLHNFMSKFSIPQALRSFLVSVLAFMPTFYPISNEKVDMQVFQICYAKIYESSLITQIPLNEATFDSIKLNQYSLSQIKQMKSDSPCPEVYLNDEDFKNITGYDRDSFYKLQFAQINAIRENMKRV